AGFAQRSNRVPGFGCLLHAAIQASGSTPMPCLRPSSRSPPGARPELSPGGPARKPGDDDLTARIVHLMRPTWLPFPYAQLMLPLLLRALLLLQFCTARLLGLRYSPPRGGT